MLNWSFAHGQSLVDWRSKDFESYVKFVAKPPKAWTMSNSQVRFVPQAGFGFDHWSINSAWRPPHDCRSIGDDGGIGNKA